MSPRSHNQLGQPRFNQVAVKGSTALGGGPPKSLLGHQSNMGKWDFCWESEVKLVLVFFVFFPESPEMKPSYVLPEVSAAKGQAGDSPSGETSHDAPF